MKRTFDRLIPDSPWRWPMIAFFALITIVIVGTVLALILGGCAAQTPRGGGGGDTVNQGAENSGFSESRVTLNDGRTVICLTWSTWDYLSEAMSSGVSCDWEGLVTSSE